MATATSTKSSSTNNHQHCQTMPPSTEHLINERYPEQIPSLMLEYLPFKLNTHLSYSRYRTPPVTLTEIHESDEENPVENNNHQQSPIITNYYRLEHLALIENMSRRTTSQKASLKTFLQQQPQLKTTREELCETDSN